MPGQRRKVLDHLLHIGKFDLVEISQVLLGQARLEQCAFDLDIVGSAESVPLYLVHSKKNTKWNDNTVLATALDLEV